MAPRALFPPVSASQETGETNEIDQETLPENTLDEVPFNNQNDIENVGESSSEDVGYVGEDATEDSPDLNNPPRRRRYSSATAFSTFSKSFTLVEQPTWFQDVKYFVFPPKNDVESFLPHYRYTPVISGFLVPFSILLQIPGLTEHWYIYNENHHVVQYRSNPLFLDVSLGISLACAVIANLCLITRFLEVRVKTMTIFCAAFLTIHDLINIVAVTVFGVQHRFDDGFTYGQSFWMTVCSTIVSSFTNATLIWDLCRTSDFNKSGSGLTRRQRTLVIITMILFCYICFGALVISFLQKLTFINALYFTLVSIETIGFGDIAPKTTGSRIFVCVYSTIGCLNIGVAIGMCRETVLEAMEVAYRKRAQKIKERWKEAKKRRQVEACWRRAIEWRLQAMEVPTWIPDHNCQGRRAGGGVRDGIAKQIGILRRAAEWAGFTERKIGHSHILHGPTGMRLNLGALTHTQLEASALEAGVPLDALLPSDLIPSGQETSAHNTGADMGTNTSAPLDRLHDPPASRFKRVLHPAAARTLTHARLSGMLALLTHFAITAVHRHAPTVDLLDQHRPTNQGINPANSSGGTSNNLQTDPPIRKVDKSASHLDFNSMVAHSSDNLDLQVIEDLDTKAFYSKLIIAWTLFFVFWTIGSAIFMVTEGWSFGISMYFCFVAFSTIGYGDFSPATPAGRSVFVVWAILGVGTMTVLVSVVQEAYHSRYKNAVHIRAFEKAVKRYRERIQNAKALSGRRGRRLNFQDHSNHTAAPADLSQDPARSTSRFSAENPMANASESNTRAQGSLEALPGLVLRYAKIFHTYIRLFVDDTKVLEFQNGDIPTENSGMNEVCRTLRNLLDEIAALGGIGKAMKEEILQDPNARHTLIMLNIEKALHGMIEAAEAAREAI